MQAAADLQHNTAAIYTNNMTCYVTNNAIKSGCFIFNRLLHTVLT